MDEELKELEITPVEIVEEDKELHVDKLAFTLLDILFSEEIEDAVRDYVLIDVEPE